MARLAFHRAMEQRESPVARDKLHGRGLRHRHGLLGVRAGEADLDAEGVALLVLPPADCAEVGVDAEFALARGIAQGDVDELDDPAGDRAWIQRRPCLHR